MTVRRLRRGEGTRVRELRLRALSDAPHAFASSYAEEVNYPMSRWDVLAEQSESGEQVVVFVAVEESAWLGMAGGFVHEHDETVATLWGMWIDGEARRRGIGRELVENIIEWVRGRGVVRLELSLSERAMSAAVLYRSLGFVATARRSPLASDSSICETVMERGV